MLKNKLSWKIAFWIVGTSFVLTIFTSLFYLKHEYDNNLENFKQFLSQTHKNNEKILELSLWHYDSIALKGILEDIVDSKAIVYAHITTTNGQKFELGRKQSIDILNKEFIFRKESNGHIYTIGKLFIQGNINYINEAVIKSAQHMIFFELLKVLIMSFFVMLLIRKLFTYKLYQLSNYTQNLHINNLDDKINIKLPSNTKEYDELDLVINSFNVMKENLSKEVEKSAKIQQELIAFRKAVEESYNSIVITDTERKIIYVNDVFEKITGYTKDEVLGKNPNILKPQNAHALYYKNMNETLNQGEIWEGELVNVKKDGTFFYEKASIIPIFIDNKLINYLAIKQDITDYKESLLKINELNAQLEQKVERRTYEIENKNNELTETITNLKETQNKLIQTEKIATDARKQAENANREKSMFLANISHELKTPLNGIKGLVYLCQIKSSDEEVLNNLNNINNYSETLLRMISDLLDISKIDAKKIDIINSNFDIKQFLKSIQEIYELECKKKKIKFLFEMSNLIPSQLFGDATRLHQIITNLLNNAIKFTNTKKGYVKLNVLCEQIDEKEVTLTFQVQDNGIGIKEEDLKTIFDPFYQTKESLNHYAGGSGLGLNICKNIIEQMGGIIRVESKLKKGSTFFVTLSLEIANATKKVSQKIVEPIFKSHTQSEQLVLVVDDNQINLDVMEGILRSVNVNCILARNGKEALELIEKHIFDLVITDIKMPIMDGCELTKHIRYIYTKEELPIIIISANEQNKTKNCHYKCEINDYIQKPIVPEKLLTSLSNYITLNDLPQPEKIKNQDTEMNNAILDVKDALNRFVNNEKLYKRSLKDFVIEVINSPFKINKGLNDDHRSEVIDYLHTIKGLSGNLSAKNFCHIATQLHDALKYGQEYEHLFSHYKKELNILENVINEYLKEEVITLDEVTKEELNADEINNFLEELLNMTQTYNTKSLKHFDSIPENLQKNDFLLDLKKHLEQYEFEIVTEKIETYFKESNAYII